MADSSVAITEGSGKNVDTRTNAGGDHRQVVVIGDPSVTDAVAEVVSLDVGSSSTAYGQVVRLAGSAQINAVAGTLGVNLGKVDGTIQVNVGKIDDNVSVKFASVAGTAGVNLGKVDGTIQTNVGKIDDIVAVKMASVSGTVGVNLGKVDGTIQVNVGKIDDVVSIRANAVAGTIGVNLGKVDGTIQVRIDPGYNVVNPSSTIIIPQTARGTANTAGGSGANTIVSPEAGHNIKVYAFSITTTAQSNLGVHFADGSSGGATRWWSIGLQAPSQGIAGANLAVTPPGYLWACGVNTTLALYLDTGSLVHYSVAYFKESA